jgi:hypothetical protein
MNSVRYDMCMYMYVLAYICMWQRKRDIISYLAYNCSNIRHCSELHILAEEFACKCNLSAKILMEEFY